MSEDSQEWVSLVGWMITRELAHNLPAGSPGGPLNHHNRGTDLDEWKLLKSKPAVMNIELQASLSRYQKSLTALAEATIQGEPEGWKVKATNARDHQWPTAEPEVEAVPWTELLSNFQPQVTITLYLYYNTRSNNKDHTHNSHYKTTCSTG